MERLHATAKQQMALLEDRTVRVQTEALQVGRWRQGTAKGLLGGVMAQKKKAGSVVVLCARRRQVQEKSNGQLFELSMRLEAVQDRNRSRFGSRSRAQTTKPKHVTCGTAYSEPPTKPKQMPMALLVGELCVRCLGGDTCQSS